MNIVLVEDELSKERSITDFLRENFSEISIRVARSVMSAIVELRQNSCDFVLLDMSLPLFDNADLSYSDTNEFDTFGGTAVLDEIYRLQLRCKVIVITAFDSLGEGKDQISLSEITLNLKHEYPEIFVESIFYNVSSLNWKQEIVRLLKQEGHSNNENIDY